MADNINTPKFRGAFVSVFRASKMKGQETSEPKFSVRAAFPVDADLSGLKKEANAAAKEKWGDAIPKNMRNPFRKNGDLDNPIVGIPEDWMVATFSRTEKSGRPGVVDAKVQDIIDETEVYSGAWYIAQVRAFAYDNAGNKGVSFGLQNLQKIKDDEPLGGRVPASKAFTAVESSSASSADDIFA